MNLRPTSSPVVLARRGVAGYRQYRIPALVVTPQGTLLAAYDGRPNLDDLPNPIDLLLRRSTDNGVTWEPQRVLRTGTGLDGYGDPSLLVDTTTGRIFCFHAAGTHAGFFEAIEGLEDADAIQHADVSVSDDDGRTWTHRRLTASLKGPGVTGLFAAAGNGTQLHTGPYAGRLLQQFVVLRHGEIFAASAYSDDHGDTWALGELLPGGNENKSVGRADGSVLLHSRATPHRLAAVSHDGGHSYGAPVPHPELPDPSDNGSLARFDGLPNVSAWAEPEHERWLLATHNHDPALRRNTVLKLSQDDGATWPYAVVLCPGSSEYSTAVRLPNGRIGVLFERNGYQEIVFTTVEPAVLLASPTTALTHDGGTTYLGPLALDVVLRSITPGRPAVWQSVGPSVTLMAGDGDWDAAAWKEIGQGYTADAPQVLSNRASQDHNYGPIVPGFKVGDVLTFSGRLAVAPTTGAPAGAPADAPGGAVVDATVTLHAEFAPDPTGTVVLPATTLPAGHAHTFTSSYTVTEADLAAGTTILRFRLQATVDGVAREVTTAVAVGMFTGTVG